MNRPTNVPAIRRPGAPGGVAATLEDLTAWVETREGRRGDPLDAAVTLRDLMEAGGVAPEVLAALVRRRTGTSARVPALSAVPGGTVPPATNTLVASATPSAVILRWNMPAFLTLSRYEVWRAQTDNLSEAVLIASPAAQLFYDPLGPASGDVYYWVRAVSTAGLPGPWNRAAGTVANTANITSGMIESLAASKIEAGYIAAALALNGAKVFGAELYAGGTTTTQTDASGNVTGFTANNPSVQIRDGFAVFNVDAFQIRNGENTLVPFEVVDGEVRINANLFVAGNITSENFELGVAGYMLDRATGTIYAMDLRAGGGTIGGMQISASGMQTTNYTPGAAGIRLDNDTGGIEVRHGVIGGFDVDAERIRYGATSPTAGTGVWIGDDDDGELVFRVGDVAGGDYFMWSAASGALVNGYRLGPFTASLSVGSTMLVSNPAWSWASAGPVSVSTAGGTAPFRYLWVWTETTPIPAGADPATSLGRVKCVIHTPTEDETTLFFDGRPNGTGTSTGVLTCFVSDAVGRTTMATTAVTVELFAGSPPDGGT